MSIISSKAPTTLQVEQLASLGETMLDMRLSARQDKMSAIEAVDAANQQKIEALKAQVSAMDKRSSRFFLGKKEIFIIIL